MTVQSIYPGRDIKPKNGRIAKPANSEGMTFEQHMAANRCGSCGESGVKLFQQGFCRKCILKHCEGIHQFIDEQREEIFNDRIRLGV